MASIKRVRLMNRVQQIVHDGGRILTPDCDVKQVYSAKGTNTRGSCSGLACRECPLGARDNKLDNPELFEEWMKLKKDKFILKE